MTDDPERTASLMTPARLAQMKPKPQASSAAWLDQMATGAGDSHVGRLRELAAQLGQQAQSRDCGALASALAKFDEALPQLDFDLLQPKGWLARATGKARTAGVEFAGQFDRIVQAARTLRDEVQRFASRQHAEAAAMERMLVEFEVEWRGIEKILDQGARWLQDMRNQLKTRQAEAGTDAEALAKIKEDTARCEMLVDRLKMLRGVSTAAQQVHQHGHAALARYATLSQTAQQLATQQWKVWEGRLSAIASSAGEGGPALNLEEPREAHRDLGRRVQQAIADCAQLTEQDAAFARQLGAFGEELKNASS
ncbi:MAG TPA: hypothetical protein VHA82_00730 [Ramlibacter sp.]|uniref:hypothetical protein n=1 Tax=Ramlibacter sp. TaxID=1917967 RepID=UPI002CAF9D97|nr:hypothetical protein [Ramlibacter sp.]HVZ42304.1 hypothetical protein [Ramlibacter sp.]